MTREAILAAAERLRFMQVKRWEPGKALRMPFELFESGCKAGLSDSDGQAITVGEAYGVDHAFRSC